MNIPNELTARYLEIKYPMSTGSDEWSDIKIDFEIEDNAIMGTVSKVESGQVDSEGIKQFRDDLEKFKERVQVYKSKDEIESKEKELLENKIRIGLEILKMILEA